LTRCDLAFLIISSISKKTGEFKGKYIAIVFSGNETIDSNLYSKISHGLMIDAIKRDHKNPQPHHYKNEINMIYKIMLGKNAKQFKADNNLDKDESIPDYLTNDQKEILYRLEMANAFLIDLGMEYSDRKECLTLMHQEYIVKLNEPCITVINV